jgi:tetratricopeptide (TPR) repeat protein
VKRRAKNANSTENRPTPPSAPNGFKQTISRGRLWALRLITLLVIPLLCLVVLELVLRVAGYGYNTSFFKPLRISQITIGSTNSAAFTRASVGTEYLVENDKFGLRFFPPNLARSPAPVVMPAHKAPGTYRIFVLGESAALGDPRPAFGAGRYLQALLRRRFPDTRFEVVCVAMTAINSHAILPIARECARYEPDCWIVYMGNNEMVGPFGAATVFGAQAPPRSLVKISLAAQKLRIGQLLMACARRIRGHSPAGSWAGMEMFARTRLAPEDPRRETVQNNFGANLRDILNVTLGTGVPVLLNTVAVNLRDCPPFASLPFTNLASGQTASFNLLYPHAKSELAASNFQSAASLFQDSARVQTNLAELHFLWAQSLADSNAISAAEHFRLACDNDALPFRATSPLNKIIHQAAAARTNAPLFFVDAAGLFASNAPAPVQLPGDEAFYEHVHFNFTGNYSLGRAWAEEVARRLPVQRTTHQRESWASQAQCDEQLGLTDWNRASVLEDMELRLEQPPFTTQLNSTQRIASIRGQIADLRRNMDTNAIASARQTYLQALNAEPADYFLHENFAEFLEAIGRLRDATAEWEQVRSLIPHHHLGHFQTGRLLALQGKYPEAKTNLLAALNLRPDLGDGWLELGKADAAMDQPAAALEEFQKAARLLPNDARIYYHMGKTLSKLDRRNEALAQLRQAVRLRPDSWQARYGLGEELAFAGRNQEALEQFQEVLRRNPRHIAAHLNMGVAFFKLGKLEEAKAQFEQTLRLEPQNRAAQGYLEQLEKASVPSKP